MKGNNSYLFPMLFIFAAFLWGCGAKTNLDACKLVTQEDAQNILKKPAQFDQQATDKAKSLSSSPGVCIYSTGSDESSPRLVVGYRVFDSVEMLKDGFADAKITIWKKQTQESLEGIGDEAVLLDGKLIALRKNKVWVQVGAMQGETADISIDALKAAARKAAASL